MIRGGRGGCESGSGAGDGLGVWLVLVLSGFGVLTKASGDRAESRAATKTSYPSLLTLTLA